VRLFHAALSFLGNAWGNMRQHNLFQAAAALSYYSLFSLAPLVLIIVAIAGFLISDADVQSALIERVRTFANDEAAELVRTIIENTADVQRGRLSIVIAGVLMIIGATTAFAQLHSILNRVWNVPAARGQSIWLFLKGRLLSFVILISIGVLLAVSLVFNTFLTNVGDFAATRFGVELTYWEPAKLMTSYGVTTLLIATIYKFLPDAPVRWTDALIGAVAASVLLELSKWVVASYVTQLDPSSAFGAAGSVVVFMLWIYVAAFIVLIGAEFSRTSATFRNAPV
jgi:membrane protein